MHSIKLLVKATAAIVILFVAFGPLGTLQQTPVAHAYVNCLANAPGATDAVVNDGQACPAGTKASTNPVNDYNKDAQANSACSGITSCLAWTIYWIGPGFASWVSSISAYFFDYIVKISLNSTAYALGFLTTSWTLVLSLANMFFIFILIYAAFTIMLRAETARTMQILAWVIAIALVVNFSFFFTRVVIDAGNIIATQFYNSIIAQPNIAGVTLDGSTGANAPVDITRGIMKSLGAEKPLTQQGFSNVQAAMGKDTSAWSTLLVLTVVFLSTAILFWMLAFGLIMIAIKFLIRIVGLWLVLIASPLAFVSKTLPKTQHFFEMWLRTLVGFSFYPAIFLFMFYVLNMFVQDLGNSALFSALASNANQAKDVGAGANAGPLLSQLADVFIRMGFLIVMMYIMLKVADWIMEQTGGLAATVMNKASGTILGGTAYTAGLAGRLGIGGAIGGTLAGAARIAAGAGNKRLASGLWSGADFLKKRSFDVRTVPGVAGGFGLAGVNVGTGQQGGFRSYEQTVKGWKGRWDKENEERKDEIQKKIEYIEARKAVKRQNELEKYDLPGLDKDLNRRQDLVRKSTAARMGGPPITAAESAELMKLVASRLDDKKRAAETAEHKPFDDLKTEHSTVTKKVEDFKTSQVLDLKAANLEKIAKYLSDAQIKAIKESNKYSYAQKDDISKIWNNTSKNAPAAKTIKEMEKLGDIHKDLIKLDRHLAAKLTTLDSHVADHEAGNLVTVDLAKAEKMKKEVETELDTLKAAATGLAGNARKEANLRVNLLQKASKRLEDAVENIKGVPAGTAGAEAPAAVTMQKK